MTDATTHTTFAGSTSFTAKDIIDAVKRIPKCPIAEAMRAKGCDPDKGWILILPLQMKSELGEFPPRYVRFSALASSTVMVRELFDVVPRMPY